MSEAIQSVLRSLHNVNTTDKSIFYIRSHALAEEAKSVSQRVTFRPRNQVNMFVLHFGCFRRPLDNVNPDSNERMWS